MTAALALVPDWYCVRYGRNEVSLYLTMAAALQWVVHYVLRVLLLPFGQGIAGLTRVGTLLLEGVCVGTEFLLIVFLWIGESSPIHDAMTRVGSHLAWTFVLSLLTITHVISIRTGYKEYRAGSMTLTVLLYIYLCYCIGRASEGHYFGYVCLLPLSLGGVTAVLALRRTPEGHDGSE